MDDKNLKKLMGEYGGRVRPSRIFALKMRYRLMKRGIQMYFARPKAVFKYATAFVLVFFMGTSGVGAYAYSSPDVNVDHPLYPVKQGMENVEMGFAWSPEGKSQMHMKKAMRRLDEAEKLHIRFRDNPEIERDAEAIQKTLRFMEEEMDNSFSTIPSEFDPEKAERFLTECEGNFGKMHDRMGKLPPLESGRPHIKMVMERIDLTEEEAAEKLERLKYAKTEVMKARQGKMRRIPMHDLMIKPPPPPADF